MVDREDQSRRRQSEMVRNDDKHPPAVKRRSSEFISPVSKQSTSSGDRRRSSEFIPSPRQGSAERPGSNRGSKNDDSSREKMHKRPSSARRTESSKGKPDMLWGVADLDQNKADVINRIKERRMDTLVEGKEQKPPPSSSKTKPADSSDRKSRGHSVDGRPAQSRTESARSSSKPPPPKEARRNTTAAPRGRRSSFSHDLRSSISRTTQMVRGRRDSTGSAGKSKKESSDSHEKSSSSSLNKSDRSKRRARHSSRAPSDKKEGDGDTPTSNRRRSLSQDLRPSFFRSSDVSNNDNNNSNSKLKKENSESDKDKQSRGRDSENSSRRRSLSHDVRPGKKEWGRRDSNGSRSSKGKDSKEESKSGSKSRSRGSDTAHRRRSFSHDLRRSVSRVLLNDKDDEDGTGSERPSRMSRRRSNEKKSSESERPRRRSKSAGRREGSDKSNRRRSFSHDLRKSVTKALDSSDRGNRRRLLRRASDSMRDLKGSQSDMKGLRNQESRRGSMDCLRSFREPSSSRRPALRQMSQSLNDTKKAEKMYALDSSDDDSMNGKDRKKRSSSRSSKARSKSKDSRKKGRDRMTRSNSIHMDRRSSFRRLNSDDNSSLSAKRSHASEKKSKSSENRRSSDTDAGSKRLVTKDTIRRSSVDLIKKPARATTGSAEISHEMLLKSFVTAAQSKTETKAGEETSELDKLLSKKPKPAEAPDTASKGSKNSKVSKTSKGSKNKKSSDSAAKTKKSQDSSTGGKGKGKSKDKGKDKTKNTKSSKSPIGVLMKSRQFLICALLFVLLVASAVVVLVILNPFATKEEPPTQETKMEVASSRLRPTNAPSMLVAQNDMLFTPTLVPAPALAGEGIAIAVLVQLDDKPEETGFYLASSDNSTIYMSYPAGSLSGRLSDAFMEVITVPLNSSLVFALTDEAGDGICCENGNGYYSVFTGMGSEKKTVISGSEFNSSINHSFIVGIETAEPTVSDPNESCKPCPDGGQNCGRCAWCNAEQGFLSDTIFSFQCHTSLVPITKKCFIGDKRVNHHNQYVNAIADCKNGFQPWPQIETASGPTVCVSEVKCLKTFDFEEPNCEEEEAGSVLQKETCQDKIGGLAFGYDWGYNAPREKECSSLSGFAESLAPRCCIDAISFCSTISTADSDSDREAESKNDATSSGLTELIPTFFPTASNAPTWNGHAITVVFQLDEWPEETGWSITSADKAITFKERKPGYYKESDLVIETIQIPEGMEVDLTITDAEGDGFCCENGQGYYQVYTEQGSLILDKSGKFTSATSSSFKVGEVNSLAPTASSSPTESSPPSFDQYTVTIVVQFDQWSQETGFSLSSAATGSVYFDWPAGSYYEPFGRVIETVKLPRDLEATLAVTDSGGDGFCCLYGEGWIKVYAGEDIEDSSALIASESGEFDSDLSVSFIVAHPSETASTSASSPVAPVTDPIPDTDDDWGDGEVTLVMQFDKYSAETGWFIDSGDGLTNYVSRPIGYYEQYPSMQIAETVVLTKGIEYKFRVTDLFGDGFCCWAGNGFYVLYKGTDVEDESNQIFYGDGEYGLEREHLFTVGRLRTPPPTNPKAPSTAPSVPPSMVASISPKPSAPMVQLDVSIKFDGAAVETGWSITSVNKDIVVVDRPAGYYGRRYNRKAITETIKMPYGQYLLIVTDTVGDGFCCRKGVGWIKVVETGNELLFREGRFEYSVEERFAIGGNTLAQNSPTQAAPGNNGGNANLEDMDNSSQLNPPTLEAIDNNAPPSPPMVEAVYSNASPTPPSFEAIDNNAQPAPLPDAIYNTTPPAPPTFEAINNNARPASPTPAAIDNTAPPAPPSFTATGNMPPSAPTNFSGIGNDTSPPPLYPSNFATDGITTPPASPNFAAIGNNTQPPPIDIPSTASAGAISSFGTTDSSGTTASFGNISSSNSSPSSTSPPGMRPGLRGSPKSSRENLIQSQLTSIFGKNFFQDPLHLRAARWIIHEDPLVLKPEDPTLGQRFVMVIFYFATDGQQESGGWMFNGIAEDRGNWLLDTPGSSECLWSGITCTAIHKSNNEEWQAVVGIHTMAFGLHGYLPKELAYLDHLQELDLSIMNYGLSGPIHSDILNMKSLNRLAIGETSLEVHIDCDKNPIEVITIGSCYNKGDDFDGTMTCHGGCCTDALTGMPCI